MNETLRKILDGTDYFITGSKRFGWATKASDTDIVIPINRVGIIRSAIKTIKESNYNSGFYALIGGEKINFIPLHPVEYVCWFYAAKFMGELPITAKPAKNMVYGIHTALVGTIKTALASEKINITNYKKFLNKEIL